MANTYDTSAFPLGSKDPRVLYNNAENEDLFVNDVVNESFVDRPPFRRNRYTLFGMEQAFERTLSKIGFESTYLTYAAGVVIQRPTQLVVRGGVYYRVTDPTNVPLTLTGDWAVDSLKLTDVGDASLRSALASTTDATLGANLIGFKRPLPAAIGRALSLKVSDTISLKDFGAKGDGVTDDTLAIQAALDFAGTFSNKLGCAVYAPQGDYLYSQLKLEHSHVKLYGDRDVRFIHTSATGAGLILGGVAARTYGLSVQGITFSNSVTGTAGAAVHAINCGQIAFKDVHTSAFPAKPYNGLLLQNVVQVGVISSSFADCVNEGYSASDSVDQYINSSRADNCGTFGWAFRTCSGLYPTQCSGFGNGTSALYTDNSVVGALAADGNAFHFYSNFIGDTSGGHNLHIKNLTNSTFSACWGSTQKLQVNEFYCGMVLDGCSGIDLVGMKLLNNNSNGLLVVGSSKGINMIGGRCSHNGRTLTASNRNGIQVGSGCSIKLVGTTLDDYATGVGVDTKTQKYGIKCDGSVASLSMASVDMLGNLTGPYSFDSTPLIMNETNNTTGEGITIASATVMNLPYFGKFFAVSGTTTISGINNHWEGREVKLVFRGALSVGDGGALKLNGNLATGANTTLSLMSDGTNLYEIARSVNG